MVPLQGRCNQTGTSVDFHPCTSEAKWARPGRKAEQASWLQVCSGNGNGRRIANAWALGVDRRRVLQAHDYRSSAARLSLKIASGLTYQSVSSGVGFEPWVWS